MTKISLRGNNLLLVSHFYFFKVNAQHSDFNVSSIPYKLYWENKSTNSQFKTMLNYRGRRKDRYV